MTELCVVNKNMNAAGMASWDHTLGGWGSQPEDGTILYIYYSICFVFLLNISYI